MYKYKVILNPVAGAGTALNQREKINSQLTSYNLDFDLVLTEYPMHAIELASAAAEEGFDVVVAAGGDGTANEVLNGLMQYKEKHKKMPVLGILPVGRGNDFSFGVNIPANLDEACSLLASQPRKWIDIGKISEENMSQDLYFGNGVGVGFDAVVGFVAAKMKLTGMLSYLVAAIKTIFIYFKPPQVTLVADSETRTLSALMISIMNGRRMGGGFMMAPSASPDDGLLSLCIVRQIPQLAMFGLMAKFMKGSHESDPAVSTAKAKKITITATQGTLPVHADGVTVCEKGHQIIIELIPKGIEIITRLES